MHLYKYVSGLMRRACGLVVFFLLVTTVHSQELVWLNGAQSTTSCVAFADDSNLLFSGSNDAQTINVWNPDSESYIRAIPGINPFSQLTSNKSGTLLAGWRTLGQTLQVLFFNGLNGGFLGGTQPSSTNIQRVANSPNGRYWAFSSRADYNYPRIYINAPGEFNFGPWISYEHHRSLLDMEISPDGRYILQVGSPLLLFAARTGAAQPYIENKLYSSGSFSSDGRSLALGRFDGAIEIADFPSMLRRAVVSGGRIAKVQDIEFDSAHDQWVALSGENQSYKVFTVKRSNGAVTTISDFGTDECHDIVLNKDCTKIFIAGGAKGLLVLDNSPGSLIRFLSTYRGLIRDSKVSRPGEQILTVQGASDCSIRSINSATGAVNWTRVQKDLPSVSVNSLTGEIAATNFNVIRLLNPQDGSANTTYTEDEPVKAVALSSKGMMAAVFSRHNNAPLIRIWKNAHEPTFMNLPPLGSGGSYSLPYSSNFRFTEDGKFLCISLANTRLYFYDTATWNLQGALTLYGTAFSHSGRYIATAGLVNGALKVVLTDLHSLTRVGVSTKELPLSKNFVAVAFSNNDRYLWGFEHYYLTGRLMAYDIASSELVYQSDNSELFQSVPYIQSTDETIFAARPDGTTCAFANPLR